MEVYRGGDSTHMNVDYPARNNNEYIAHSASLSSEARAQFIDFARELNIIIIKN